MTGWQCPLCKRIYPPTTHICPLCAVQKPKEEKNE